MNDTPTPLPGNPEAEAVARLTAATTVAAEGDPSANVLALLTYTQATLALAFEVRTANLQAVQKMTLDMLLNPNFDVANEAEAAAEIDSLNDQINTRLGLGGDDER